MLGTGIGGGIVVGGRLHVGRHGRGGELGHVIVVPGGPPCGCGNAGCLEAVATSGAIAARAGQPDVAAAFAAAAAGDERAVAAIAAMVDALGRAIAGMITVLVPERVVVGGGVAEAGAALFDPLRAAVDRHVTPRATTAGTRWCRPRSAPTPVRSAPPCGPPSTPSRSSEA